MSQTDARALFADPATARHIARLARLELDPAALGLIGRQLGDILDHIESLAAVDTTGVEPPAGPDAASGYREPGRRLVLAPGEHVANAPDRAGDAFRVPKVI